MRPKRARSLYRKLKPGPGVPAEEVASHQRQRIHGAMIEIVAAHGYDAVTVSELTALAGVSTHTFYERFAGKDECFLCTYDLLVREGARQVVSSQTRQADWRERLRAAIHAFVAEVERQPGAARMALVEVFAAGPAALKRMRWAEAVFEATIAKSVAASSEAGVVSPHLVRGIVAGIAGVLRSRLLDGRGRELTGVAEELSEWALCFGGEESGALDEQSAPPDSEREGPSNADDLRAMAGDDRAAILIATARLATAEGYGELTVSRIRAAAGVSRRSFDSHFDGVSDCFLVALEAQLGHLLADAVDQARVGRSWPASVHRASTALCTEISRDRVLARLAFVEVFATGIAGVESRARLAANSAAIFRDSAPPSQQPSRLAAEASVEAVSGVLRHRVASGGAVIGLAETVSFFGLAPAIGPRAALETICEERAPRAAERRLAIAE